MAKIASMTAFARNTADNQWGTITWEIRTVNHRYLEINLRLSEMLRHLEMPIREKIQNKMNRGKLDATLKFQPGEALPFDVHINQALVTKLSNVGQKIMHIFPEAKMNVMDILNWQGVLQTKQLNVDVIGKSMLDLLDNTLSDLVMMRQREGEQLKSFISERINKITQNMQRIEAHGPQSLAAAKEKILSRFNEIKLSVDQDRLEQEMLWMVQKVDVAEELDRIKAHIVEVQRIIDSGGVIGRRLDFLMQELNREANTIASKSMDVQVTKAVVEIKILLEQIREQVQNIE